MSECEPFAYLGPERVEARQDNTSLYQHLARVAMQDDTMYDNIFIVMSEDSGMFMWRHHPQYRELLELAIENNCPMHLNLPHAADIDIRAFEADALEGLEESTEWEE